MTDTPANLRTALAASPFSWLAVADGPNVGYATGYRSVGGELFAGHRMVALVSVDRTVLVGGASDGAAAIEAGIAPEDYVPFGTFYFESPDDSAPESHLADRHASLEEAVGAAAAIAGLTGSVGVDRQAAQLTASLSRERCEVVDATDWMYDLRSVKLPSEVDLLRRSARLAEQGIDAAINAATVGMSESALAAIVAGTMAEGGATPRFVVVTSGPRSALSDARPTARALTRGDLLRFDVGCTLDGYWSDIGRTAVVGAPSALQASRYEAIWAGEQAQLTAAEPGITAEELFSTAVAAVESAGLQPYRRHHCGHAIGTEPYERPIVAPDWTTQLRPGMVLCVETPFYEIGWGGMMVEDAILITETGVEVLTTSDRSLRVIEA